MTELDFSIVMPVYNEEKGIAESVRRIRAFMSLKNKSWELLVVSDGSTDGTDGVVGSLEDEHVKLIRSPQNKGKGAAVRRGVLASRGRLVLVTDADLSAPIKESEKLVAAIAEGCDVAIGSRAVKKSGCDVRQSWRRRVAGRVFNWLVRLIVLGGYGDTQCGFKCFTREAALKLFDRQRLDGFAFDVEILYLARAGGLRVKEVPVMWSQGSQSRIRFFRDSARMVRELFQIKRLHSGGSA